MVAVPILVVGSVALDTIETPKGKVKEIPGGSAVYFSIAASFFSVGVNLVAVIGKDFPGDTLEFLKKRNIDLQGLEKVDGKTFRWTGKYEQDLNTAHTLDTQLNVFEKFSPKIPSAYQQSPYIFLANIDPELHNEVLNQTKLPRLVVCDTMNHWIEHKKSALKEVLKKVNILVINEAETKQLAEETDLLKAAQKIISWSPSQIMVIKQGNKGALCVNNSSFFTVPAYHPENVYDPTGAGDSFAGGFLGYLAQTGDLNKKNLRQAVIFGNVMGSFCVESFGLKRFHTLTYSEIKKRSENMVT